LIFLSKKDNLISIILKFGSKYNKSRVVKNKSVNFINGLMLYLSSYKPIIKNEIQEIINNLNSKKSLKIISLINKFSLTKHKKAYKMILANKIIPPARGVGFL
jgi:hypothetical protein